MVEESLLCENREELGQWIEREEPADRSDPS